MQLLNLELYFLNIKTFSCILSKTFPIQYCFELANMKHSMYRHGAIVNSATKITFF